MREARVKLMIEVAEWQRVAIRAHWRQAWVGSRWIYQPSCSLWRHKTVECSCPQPVDRMKWCRVSIGFASVGDRVSGQYECPLIVTTQQNRRVRRHQAEECEQALQTGCFLCCQSQRNILGSTRAKCHTPLLFGRPRDYTNKTTYFEAKSRSWLGIVRAGGPIGIQKTKKFEIFRAFIHNR